MPLEFLDKLELLLSLLLYFLDEFYDRMGQYFLLWPLFVDVSIR